jgi:SAM-dependent methyltransferase
MVDPTPEHRQASGRDALVTKGIRLELGSGKLPTPGFIHHDRIKHSVNIDVAHDLEVLPWPWANESCGEILALDVFAHLHRMPAAWLRECHRILMPGGVLRFRVPIFGSPWHIIDPTHVRGFHPLNFDYFIRGRELYGKYGHYYFDFSFGGGSVKVEDHNIVATLNK